MRAQSMFRSYIAGKDRLEPDASYCVQHSSLELDQERHTTTPCHVFPDSVHCDTVFTHIDSKGSISEAATCTCDQLRYQHHDRPLIMWLFVQSTLRSQY